VGRYYAPCRETSDAIFKTDSTSFLAASFRNHQSLWSCSFLFLFASHTTRDVPFSVVENHRDALVNNLLLHARHKSSELSNQHNFPASIACHRSCSRRQRVLGSTTYNRRLVPAGASNIRTIQYQCAAFRLKYIADLMLGQSSIDIPELHCSRNSTSYPICFLGERLPTP
jgi:hypothetical protein